ncbi:unnamed protein product [Coccothraustes coccothraustes]
MEQRPLKVPKLAWVEEEEEGLGAAPAEDTQEGVWFHAQQDGAALERTQEQDPTRGLFHRTAQVPALVRYIHQWFLDNDSAEHRLDKPLLDLTEAQPADVIKTLLCVSPLCDRFAVQILRSLLCRMQQEDVVDAMERNCGWDALLSVDTGHYFVGLLAREMCCVSIPLCSRIFCYLLRLLSTQEPHWDLPALAFLVEVLEFLDLREHDADRVLQIFSRYLQSECRERRLLAFKALLKLTDNPLMTKKMWSLTQRLVRLLRDEDGEIVKIKVMVLSFIILDKDTPIPSLIAVQLAEALPPLFDHNNSQVQQLSILLFQTLLTLPLEKKIKALKTQVRHSLLPLFFHCHDENRRVAQASRETLHSLVKFLKRKDLEKLVTKEKLWILANCLLEEDRSTVAEHLRQALPYLQSPQESLRVEAIRFIGEPRAQDPCPPHRSSAPAPPASPAAPPGPSPVEPRLASALLLPSGSHALGRQHAARAWAEPCRASRACGHSAGSAAGRELCRWGRDRLCVHRHRWTELD